MTTALYRHYDADDRPIYYGISDDPEQRLTQHRGLSLWAGLSARCTEEWFPSREAADAAERAAVPCDEPLFNREYNTPGCEERLVRYLVEKGLTGMLTPAWPQSRTGQPKAAVAERATPQSYYSSALEQETPYDDEATVMRLPQHFRSWSMGVSDMFLPPNALRARFADRERFCGSAPGKAGADEYARTVLDLQALMNDETRRFEILMGGALLAAEGENAEEACHRVAAATYRPNVRVGCLPYGRRQVCPPSCDFRIFDYVLVLDGFLGDQVESSGRASRVQSRHLDLLWRTAVTGDELRGLLRLKLAGVQPAG
jgi:hypothetical protein